MAPTEFIEEARLLQLVATEAVEEPDAISRHPEVVDVVSALANRDGLNALFGNNGHDPAAFATALAEGLAPYRDRPLTDAPELIEALALLAVALKGEYVDEPVHTPSMA